MQFNVPITLNRVTYNQYAEPETVESHDIKCALMDVSERPVRRSSGKSNTLSMTIMVPHKNIEPYASIMTTNYGQTFTYNGAELQIAKLNPIPGFSGKYKYYEILLKENLREDESNL